MLYGNEAEAYCKQHGHTWYWAKRTGADSFRFCSTCGIRTDKVPPVNLTSRADVAPLMGQD